MILPGFKLRVVFLLSPCEHVHLGAVNMILASDESLVDADKHLAGPLREKRRGIVPI